MDLSTGGLFPPALPLEWSRVVRDGALNGKATEGTKREGHGSLEGEAYYRRNAKEGARAAGETLRSLRPNLGIQIRT